MTIILMITTNRGALKTVLFCLAKHLQLSIYRILALCVTKCHHWRWKMAGRQTPGCSTWQMRRWRFHGFGNRTSRDVTAVWCHRHSQDAATVLLLCK